MYTLSGKVKGVGGGYFSCSLAPPDPPPPGREGPGGGVRSELPAPVPDGPRSWRVPLPPRFHAPPPGACLAPTAARAYA